MATIDNELSVDLHCLVGLLRLTVGESQLQEAAFKLSHDEYGLALQAIVGALVECKVIPDESIQAMLLSLARRMGMCDEQDDDHWLYREILRLRSDVEGR